MIETMNRLRRLPKRRHGLLAAGSLAVVAISNSVLDASYRESQHPVGYAEGQTTFSAETIRGYYQTMTEAGTLDIYWRTQFIDFAFIASVILVGLFVPTLIGRFCKASKAAKVLTMLATPAVVVGATFDIAENLVSFVMLANPASFADWLAYLYSGLAAAKFAAIGLGVIALALSVVLQLWSFGRLQWEQNMRNDWKNFWPSLKQVRNGHRS